LQTFGIGLLKAWEQQTFTEVDRLAKIRRFISNHAHEKLTVEDLGRELFISGSRARHLVSELSGRSFSELLTEERMIRARKLLLFSECSLAEIAEASGYANVHYFSRHFSEYYGLPPGRYRKQFQV
jgi:YesN/AraC family two-component response regulator